MVAAWLILVIETNNGYATKRVAVLGKHEQTSNVPIGALQWPRVFEQMCMLSGPSTFPSSLLACQTFPSFPW